MPKLDREAMRKRGRPRIDRGRERILDSAEGAIEREARLEVPLGDVVREAAVSRRTAYRLFPGGRAEVVEATVQRAAERFSERLGARVARLDDPLELLVEAIDFTLTEVPRDAVLAVALKERAVATLRGGIAGGSRLPIPAEVLVSRYRELLPNVADDQVASLLELVRRITLSTLVLGEADELLRGDDVARAKITGWLRPIVSEHRASAVPASGAEPPRKGD